MDDVIKDMFLQRQFVFLGLLAQCTACGDRSEPPKISISFRVAVDDMYLRVVGRSNVLQ